jgi:ribonucleoside-diphosphate reductase alpha chain
MNEINVLKRDGSKEPLNIEKINKVLLWAVEGINDVSASEIAMNANLQFYDGIKSSEIHEVLVNSAVDLISEDSPNYDMVAGKLYNMFLRKEVFNTFEYLPTLYDHIEKMIELGKYHDNLLNLYTKEEIENIGSKILNHKRDWDYTYASIKQMSDKYLIKDRDSGQIFETPQFMYIAIAMQVCSKIKDKKKRFTDIKSKYNDYSAFYISLSTPVVAGIRTITTQYSSCTLIECGDNIPTIKATSDAIVDYTAKRAGIGLGVGRIRAVGDKIRNGEVIHTGVIPFLKTMESNTKSVHQNGLRGGGGTVHVPIWHKQINDIIVLKNNKGTNDTRVRKLDYSIQFSSLFWKRFINNDIFALFSPNDVPELYDTYGLPEFDEIYTKAEADENIPKEWVSAQDLITKVITERFETGRIYIMNMDNVNEHTTFITYKGHRIAMSNLCQEINLVTSPLNHNDDGRIVKRMFSINNDQVENFTAWCLENDIYIKGKTFGEFQAEEIHECTNMPKEFGFELSPINVNDRHAGVIDMEVAYGDAPAEIALCTLAAVNLGKIRDYKDFERVCRNIVDTLEWVIDEQEYPVHAALKMLKRRSLGIGVTNFAYWMAKKGFSYEDPEVLPEIHRMFEHFTYNCIKASNDVAIEKGACEWFHKTKFSNGELIIDNYHKNVDKLVPNNLECDWDGLRESIKTFGVRHSTLNAYMPVESSSVISNSTNGLEPPRTPIQTKTSKAGAIKMVIPGYTKYKNKYTYAFDMESNEGISNIHAIIQKFTDQGISCNHYYDPAKYEDGKVPMSEVAHDLIRFAAFGGKQLYYANTNDGKSDEHDLSENVENDEELGDSMDSGCGDACVL